MFLLINPNSTNRLILKLYVNLIVLYLTKKPYLLIILLTLNVRLYGRIILFFVLKLLIPVMIYRKSEVLMKMNFPIINEEYADMYEDIEEYSEDASEEDPEDYLENISEYEYIDKYDQPIESESYSFVTQSSDSADQAILSDILSVQKITLSFLILMGSLFFIGFAYKFFHSIFIKSF